MESRRDQGTDDWSIVTILLQVQDRANCACNNALESARPSVHFCQSIPLSGSPYLLSRYKLAPYLVEMKFPPSLSHVYTPRIYIVRYVIAKLRTNRPINKSSYVRSKLRTFYIGKIVKRVRISREVSWYLLRNFRFHSRVLRHAIGVA